MEGMRFEIRVARKVRCALLRCGAWGISLLLVLSACSDSKTRPPGDTVRVYLGLKRQTEALADFVGQVSDPTNEDTYGRYITVDEVADILEVTEDTKRTTIDYLAGIGVPENCVKLDPIGSTYVVEMPRDVASNIFCYDPTSQSTCIPDALTGAVTEVMIVTRIDNEDGGSQGQEPSPPMSSDRGNHGTPEGCKEGVDTGAYTPNQYRTAYGVDALWEKGLTGKGVRVAIINSFHWDKEGIATFTSCFDLGTPNVHMLRLWSDRTSVDISAEAYLDTEMVLAIAPEAEITSLTIGTNTMPQFIQGLAAILDANNFHGGLPHVVSSSFIPCESDLTKDEMGLAETYLMAAAAVGMSIVNASGDGGFLQGCVGSVQGAVYPASSAYTTGAGGTNMDLHKDNTIAEQTVWEDDSGGESGSGPSSLFSIPDWQHGQGIDSHSPTQRLTPDIALFANDDTPGIAFYGKRIVFPTLHWIAMGGGTSASAPMFAGMVALWVQQRIEAGKTALGLVNPLLYHMANSSQYDELFYDVVKGTSNCDPSKTEWDEGGAGPGYDMATGLGSPKTDAVAEYIKTLP